MVEGAQSCFTSLAAGRESAARQRATFGPLLDHRPHRTFTAVLPHRPKTRVGVFSGTPSGRLSRRGRKRSINTPGSRGCAYKTASGRHEWPSRDPIGEAGGINLYDYVANNPINRIDPFGLRDWSCGETQGFLNQAKEEGFLEAFFNHSQYGLYGKNTGAFDFGQNPDFAGDTFDVGGETLSASQFGNYIAGYGSEYAGGSIGYSAARLMGIVYDKGLDKDSVPDIDKGADRAKKEMQSNGSNGSSGSGCPCN